MPPSQGTARSRSVGMESSTQGTSDRAALRWCARELSPGLVSMYRPRLRRDRPRPTVCSSAVNWRLVDSAPSQPRAGRSPAPLIAFAFVGSPCVLLSPLYTDSRKRPRRRLDQISKPTGRRPLIRSASQQVRVSSVHRVDHCVDRMHLLGATGHRTHRLWWPSGNRASRYPRHLVNDHGSRPPASRSRVCWLAETRRARSARGC